MIIREAQNQDIPALMDLLSQVLAVHHEGRPDLFKANATKYTPIELEQILADPLRPVFVAVQEEKVVGYCFGIVQQLNDHAVLTPVKTLYIDDLCVDKNHRHLEIGKTLYEAMLAYAQAKGCYNLTLNVWAFNESARAFYEACGLKPQRMYMEKILQEE